MIKFYVTQVKMGKITFENIPERWQFEVNEML